MGWPRASVIRHRLVWRLQLGLSRSRPSLFLCRCSDPLFFGQFPLGRPANFLVPKLLPHDIRTTLTSNLSPLRVRDSKPDCYRRRISKAHFFGGAQFSDEFVPLFQSHYETIDFIPSFAGLVKPGTPVLVIGERVYPLHFQRFTPIQKLLAGFIGGVVEAEGPACFFKLSSSTYVGVMVSSNH